MAGLEFDGNREVDEVTTLSIDTLLDTLFDLKLVYVYLMALLGGKEANVIMVIWDGMVFPKVAQLGAQDPRKIMGIF